MSEKRPWCKAHYRRLAHTEGASVAYASALLPRRLYADARFRETLRAGQGEPSLEALLDFMQTCGPICCFLGEATLSSILEEARRPPPVFAAFELELREAAGRRRSLEAAPSSDSPGRAELSPHDPRALGQGAL